MEKLLDFLTALCAGCSVGCIAFYIIRALSGIELERKTSFEKPIPILFKLL